MSARQGFLRHPLLADFGHGFGTRGALEPSCYRPQQVHGCRVEVLRRAPGGAPRTADAVIAMDPGTRVGVVTADCVPILIAHPSGTVAAVHAGWRGLACGVIAATLEQLTALGVPPREATAVIGPHICVDHYEIDEPVWRALAPRFGAALERALRDSRPGHWLLELDRLARMELEAGGLAPQRIATLADGCTFADARFVSRRRDGASSARLLHFITARLAIDSCESCA